MTNKSDFFGCVAKHNLERFHSECIVWAFNNSTEMLERFIKKTEQNPYLNIEVARAFSETSDIDILIYYKADGKDYLIHIENKVKAEEGKKKITKKVLSDINLTKDLTIEKFKERYNLKRNYLSQTEYYYLRHKRKITETIVEVLRKWEIELKTTKVSWSYVYLVPALGKNSDNSLNIWKETIDDKPNPWLNLSYADIINCMPDNIIDIKSESNKMIFKEYKKYLKIEFSEAPERIIEFNEVNKHKIIEITDVNKHRVESIIEVTKGKEQRCVIRNDTLSSKNLNLVLDEEVETTTLESFGMQIHFLKLKDSLTKFCDDNINKDYKFEVEFLTETGNNGGYLIQAYTVIKLENPKTSIFEKTDPIDFRIGFQFEQNKKYDGKFKFYFADLLYEPNLIINEKTKNKPPAKTQHLTYNAAVKEILINVFTVKYLHKKRKCKKFSGSRSLSFCSFLSDYEFKNSNEIEQKFKDEILHLISRIKDKSLEEHIQLLSK